jgi:hypothetical protein
MSGHAHEPPHELHERDAMLCRRCGKEERASEGYPCRGCGTFLCLICTFRGHVYCLACEEGGEGEQGQGRRAQD